MNKEEEEEEEEIIINTKLEKLYHNFLEINEEILNEEEKENNFQNFFKKKKLNENLNSTFFIYFHKFFILDILQLILEQMEPFINNSNILFLLETLKEINFIRYKKLE